MFFAIITLLLLGVSFSSSDCGSLCLQCISSRFCTKCIKETFMVDLPMAVSRFCVEKCEGQYYLQEASQKCKKCPNQCLECRSQKQCTKCAEGFELSQDGECLEVPRGRWFLFFGIGICCLGMLARACSRIKRQKKVEPPAQLNESSYDLSRVSMEDIQTSECSVCLQVDTNVRTECEHSFHLSCLIPWLSIRPVCPNCIKNLIYSRFLVTCPCRREKLMQLKDLFILKRNGNMDEYRCKYCTGMGRATHGFSD